MYDDGAGSKQNGAHQLATRLGANQDTSLPFEGDNVPDFIELLSGGTVTARYRLIKNQVGTVLAVVDATSGEVAQRIEYDEFGRVLFDSNPGLQPFGFAGGLYDAESRLVRFGARDYEPTTGRWTARDPVRFHSELFNYYAYSLSSPTVAVDWAGATPWSAGAAVGFAIGGAWGAATGFMMSPCSPLKGALVGGLAGAAGGAIGGATLNFSTAVGAAVGAVTGALGNAATGGGLPSIIAGGTAGAIGGAIGSLPGGGLAGVGVGTQLGTLGGSALGAAADSLFGGGSPSPCGCN